MAKGVRPDKMKPKISDSKKRGSNHSMNPHRKPGDVSKGMSKPRTAGTIKRLQMYRCSKAKRNAEGKIIRPAPFQSYVNSGTRARLEPSRTWFSNSKVIGQNALQKFQEEMKTAMKDPYKVIMRKSSLPVTLLNESSKHARVHLLETESFETTFGKKAVRKRPRVSASNMEELVKVYFLLSLNGFPKVGCRHDRKYYVSVEVIHNLKQIDFLRYKINNRRIKVLRRPVDIVSKYLKCVRN
jgi:NGP1NT (NUC091) domain